MSDEPKQETRRVPLVNFSRVVGYYSPVQLWNRGKAQEWKDRKPYTGKVPQ